MLVRLQVDGFKNLVDTELLFGPLTCVAGPNGVGKSNLFDALRFLSALADRPLLEAAASVRSDESGRTANPTTIFHRFAGQASSDMRFEVEMLVPREALDDLGQRAVATNTLLRYTLWLRREAEKIRILREELGYVTKTQATKHLRFPHAPKWRNSVVEGKRRGPLFISTESESGQIFLHQDGSAGRPRPHLAAALPRTVLSTANAAEARTVLVARREMRSWRLLQLEPAALREPDTYAATRHLGARGSHMPATLARRIEWQPDRRPGAAFEPDQTDVCAQISGRLAELIDGVRSISLDADDRRELLTVLLSDTSGNEFEARSLSDGTLRFLALAILESDPLATGLICLEEPENGIHPERIPAMVRLLEDIAVDSTLPVDDTNPLRQVLVNTHSPRVVGHMNQNHLLVAVPEQVHEDEGGYFRPRFLWLSDTWRSSGLPDETPIQAGDVVEYLSWGAARARAKGGNRVVDRADLQRWLPGFAPRPESGA